MGFNSYFVICFFIFGSMVLILTLLIVSFIFGNMVSILTLLFVSLYLEARF